MMNLMTHPLGSRERVAAANTTPFTVSGYCPDTEWPDPGIDIFHRAGATTLACWDDEIDDGTICRQRKGAPALAEASDGDSDSCIHDDYSDSSGPDSPETDR